jgi:hypothetical protein
MKKFSLLVLGSFFALLAFAQNEEEQAVDTTWKKMYRETSPIINDLVLKLMPMERSGLR